MKKYNFEDFKNKKFNQLTVISLSNKVDENKRTYFRFKCDCGKEKEICAYLIISGRQKSCGCMVHNRTKIEDYLGKKYGKLTVIGLGKKDNSKNKYHRTYFEVKCDCGENRIVDMSKLKNGHTKSCGCTKDRSKMGNRKPKGVSARNRIINMYKGNAQTKNLEFNLGDDYLIEMFGNNCHYCGCKPSRETKYKRVNGQFIWNGIDRINNNLGYTEENTVPCCTKCNYKKYTDNQEDFLEWIKKVYKNNFTHE